MEAADSSRKLAHIYQQNGWASPGACELYGFRHKLYSHGRIYLLSLSGLKSFVPLQHAATEWFCLLLYVTINVHFLQRTYFMEHSPGSKACSVPAAQETLRILWELKVHYSAHNSPQLVLVFRPVIPVYTSLRYFFMIDFNIIPSTFRFSK